MGVAAGIPRGRAVYTNIEDALESDMREVVGDRKLVVRSTGRTWGPAQAQLQVSYLLRRRKD